MEFGVQVNCYRTTWDEIRASIEALVCRLGWFVHGIPGTDSAGCLVVIKAVSLNPSRLGLYRKSTSRAARRASRSNDRSVTHPRERNNGRTTVSNQAIHRFPD